jgi:hypothetical protein
VRHAADPPVTRIHAHQPARLARHFPAERVADVHDLDRAFVGQVRERKRGAKRVLLRAQMPDHADPEPPLRRRCGARDARRLIDDPHLAAPAALQLACLLLQRDQKCREPDEPCAAGSS